MDPHAFEEEEAPSFLHDDLDAENGGKSLPQLGGLSDLDQPISALLLTRQIRTLVGDQMGNCIGFLPQLQPSSWSLEIGVSLDQRPSVFGAELQADFDGLGGIAISRLQLQISARPPDAATLAAHGRHREWAGPRLP